MHDALVLHGLRLDPPRFCAPMAGLTHCAFRRLLADYGGYGALFSEMLAAKPLLHEEFGSSPRLRHRAQDGLLFYQLLAGDTQRLETVVERAEGAGAAGLDLNCACSAPDARLVGGGSVLFEDPDRLTAVLTTLRRCCRGALTVKIRLGRATEGWQDRFRERLRRIEDSGVDGIFLHARFEEDKFKRPARPQYLAWAASQTSLPIIANGDITGPDYIQTHDSSFAGTKGVMVGRMALARPWIFATWDGPGAIRADYAQAWRALFGYVCEDFPPHQALQRLKLFTGYFARNFAFGQTLYARVQGASTLAALQDRAESFLEAAPALVTSPCFSGV